MNFLFDDKNKSLKEIDGRNKRSLIKRVYYADAPEKKGYDAKELTEMLLVHSAVLFTNKVTYGTTGIVIFAEVDNIGFDSCAQRISEQCDKFDKYFLFRNAECSDFQTLFFGSLISKDILTPLFRNLHINKALKVLK